MAEKDEVNAEVEERGEAGTAVDSDVEMGAAPAAEAEASDAVKRPALWLARHGETEWSRDGRHTGRSDIPLTPAGEAEARALEDPMSIVEFTRVLTSPLSRAAETCELAGFRDRAQPRDELLEWDYGDYEGKTSAEIREERPDWLLWRDGCPDGESPGQIGARVDSLIGELLDEDGPIAIFAHGHVLRVLAARWIGLGPEGGKLLKLNTATLSRLGWEHDYRVIERWNAEA
ncbi:MAG: histidine phosphatase family protein [Solirubrobacterales bacterium]|nr:histidine phosphatase family protein [Solirubrobacterales bacterium]